MHAGVFGSAVNLECVFVWTCREDPQTSRIILNPWKLDEIEVAAGTLGACCFYFRELVSREPFLSTKNHVSFRNS